MFGAGDDLEIFHSGTHSIIKDSGTGNLQIAGSLIQLTNAAISASMLVANEGGSVELNHNGSKKLETTSNGISVTGSVIPTGNVNLGDSSNSNNNRFIAGASDDLQIYHDGSHSYIEDSGTGNLRILTSSTFTVNNAANSQNMILATDGGNVELYHAGNKKIETTSTGVTTTGRVRLDVNSSTVFPTSFGNEAFLPYDHELVIDNNTGGNQGSFAGIFFNAGADTDGSKVSTARITAEEVGNYKADLIFSTRNTSFTQKMRIKADGKVGIGINPPLAQLHIKPPSNITQLLLEQNNATDGYALFQDGPNGGHLKFMRHINGTETQKLLLRSNGGLCFGTDSAAANALDDYEEGLWTPAISGVTYTDTQGHYVKIGTTCFVTLTLNGANTSKTGDVRITGLPFTPKVDGGEFYPANSIPFFEVSSISLASGFQNLYARIDDGAGNIQLLVSDGESHNTLAGGGGTTLNSGHILRTSFTYLTGS